MPPSVIEAPVPDKWKVDVTFENLQVDSFKKSLKFKQKIRANFRPVIYYCPYFLIFSQKMAQKADFNNKLKFFYIYYFLNLRIIQCKMKWQSNILLRIKCYLKKC